MKTASWSLALVAAAGTVRATEEDCPEESDPSWSVPAYPAESSSYAAPVSSAPAWSAPAYPAESSSYASPVSSVPSYPSEPAWPSGGEPSGPVIVTNTITNTKYVCPCEQPTRTPGEVYVTATTTEYTTTCPGTGQEATYTWGDWTSLYTSYEISTITDTITVTLTEPYPESSAGAYPSSAPAYPSGSAPAGYPSGLLDGAIHPALPQLDIRLHLPDLQSLDLLLGLPRLAILRDLLELATHLDLRDLQSLDPHLCPGRARRISSASGSSWAPVSGSASCRLCPIRLSLLFCIPIRAPGLHRPLTLHRRLGPDQHRIPLHLPLQAAAAAAFAARASQAPTNSVGTQSTTIGTTLLQRLATLSSTRGSSLQRPSLQTVCRVLRCLSMAKCRVPRLRLAGVTRSLST